MANDYYFALIAEGAAEQAILEVLLDNNRLKFQYEDLLQEEIIRTRAAKQFQKKYLTLDLSKKVKIFRILDSEKEKFNLGKAYSKYVEEIIELYTAPEIEILFIISQGDYHKYVQKEKTKKKPSEYVRENYNHLGLNNIKNHDDVYYYWNNHVEELVLAIKDYANFSKHDSKNTLASILK